MTYKKVSAKKIGRLCPPKIGTVNIERPNYNDVKNPSRRRELNRVLFAKRKHLSKMNRIKRIKETGVRYEPKTIENTSIIENKIDFSDPNEMFKLKQMQKNDELEHIISGKDYPKILITTSLKSSRKLEAFLFEFRHLFHQKTAFIFRRKKVSIRNLMNWSNSRGYTHIIVVNQNHRLKSVPNQPGLIVDQLLIIKLPHGPTAWLRMSGVELFKQIKHAALPILHYPELVFKNFGTWVGMRLKRILMSLYPWDKNELKRKEERNKHRRIITFWCQRDFVFWRHHRWDFNADVLNSRKVITQEVGPRSTMKLLKLRKGLFGDKQAQLEFEYISKMYRDRRQFYVYNTEE